jgi:predicted transcriptional regulator
MEKAGLVDHDKEGVTHLYRPTVSRQEATGNLLSDFLARFFHGSAEQLIVGLVDADKLAPEELRAIEARLSTAGGPRKRDEETQNAPPPRGRKRRKP